MKKTRILIYTLMFIAAFFMGSNAIKAQENVATYDGELGIIYTNSGTNFNLWSSSATKIELVLEGEDNPIQLTKNSGNNVWNAYVEGDLLNKTYTYTIYYGELEIYNDVLDPYGKFVNSEKNKNVVYENSLNDFTEWSDQQIQLSFEETSKIIYGINIENFTRNSSWGGEENLQGKLLALIEEGTKYSGVSTGFDHIKSLGITYVELNNIFDINNPFVIDYQYVSASENYAGNLEMKKLVNKFYQNGIGVIVTIDLNGFSQVFLQNLSKIDKSYYLNDEGNLNQEKFMVQKYIKDYVNYVAKEYKLEGIKFENMSQLKLNLMNEISTEIKEINPSIMLYGEGSYDVLDEYNAGENNLSNLTEYSMLNGSLSYGLLGDLNNLEINGALSGNYSKEMMESIKFALLSSVDNGNIDYSLVKGVSYKAQWVNDRTYQLINYIGLDDGLSIHDKLYLSGISSMSAMQQKIILAYGTLMISGGIPYISSGNEFLMSYRTVDELNSRVCDSEGNFCFHTDANKKQIDWSNVHRYETIVDAIKALINFRKDESNIAQTSVKNIKNYVRVYQQENNPGIIGYIRNYPNAYVNGVEKVFVLFNYSDTEYVVSGVEGDGWTGLYNYNNAQREEDVITMTPNSIHIEYKVKQPKVSTWVTLIFVVGLIGIVYFLNVVLSKKLVKQGHDIKDIKRKYRPFVKKEFETKENESDDTKKDKEA